jgi:hypothetical protein
MRQSLFDDEPESKPCRSVPEDPRQLPGYPRRSFRKRRRASVRAAHGRVQGTGADQVVPAVRKRAPRSRAFSPESDVTLGGQPASRFTWRTTDAWSRPNRWPDTSLREQSSYMPDKGRNYTERGGANPTATIDSKLRCRTAQRAPSFPESSCIRH